MQIQADVYVADKECYKFTQREDSNKREFQGRCEYYSFRLKKCRLFGCDTEVKKFSRMKDGKNTFYEVGVKCKKCQKSEKVKN